MGIANCVSRHGFSPHAVIEDCNNIRAVDVAEMAPGMLRLLYWLYELHLQRQIRAQAPPRHVGIILDGNRRYARNLGFTDLRRAYDLGAGKLDDVLDWCSDLEIPAVTLWVCSIDNLTRPPEEVSSVLGAVETKIAALTRAPAIHRHHVRIRAAGRLELLPPSVVAVIRKAEEVTASYEAMTLTIAIAYGGREEIADAARSLIRDLARKIHGGLADVVQAVEMT